MIAKARRMIQSIPSDVKCALSRFPASCLVVCGMTFSLAMFSQDVSLLVLMYLASLCVCLTADLYAERAGMRRLPGFAAAFGAAVCTFSALYAFRKLVPAPDFVFSLLCFALIYLPLGVAFGSVILTSDIRRFLKTLLRCLLCYLAAWAVIMLLWLLASLLIYFIGFRKLIYAIILSLPFVFALTTLPAMLVIARLPKLPK